MFLDCVVPGINAETRDSLTHSLKGGGAGCKGIGWTEGIDPVGEE